MSNKMIKNKKAQVSQTINWVVATIVIIVIIVITLLLANGDWYNQETKLNDKQKDFIASKSLVNFLSDDVNILIIKNTTETGDYSLFDEKLKPILEELSYNSDGIWVCDVTINDGFFAEHFLNPFGATGKNENYILNIVFYNLEKKIKLQFENQEILQ